MYDTTSFIFDLPMHWVKVWYSLIWGQPDTRTLLHVQKGLSGDTGTLKIVYLYPHTNNINIV